MVLKKKRYKEDPLLSMVKKVMMMVVHSSLEMGFLSPFLELPSSLIG